MPADIILLRKFAILQLFNTWVLYIRTMQLHDDLIYYTYIGNSSSDVLELPLAL